LHGGSNKSRTFADEQERRMGFRISGLDELRERLERLRPEEVMARALAEQAERMAASVRDGLSEPPDAAGHDEPWLRSGALRDSVGAQADGLQAAVGSSDPAAVPQELGTAHMPARPFLAPVAAGMGEEVARAVGARVAAALRGDSTDANGTDADLSGGSLGDDNLPNWSGAGAGTPRTSNGGFMLASGKADGQDDPLRELRKDLGEETPEEKEEEIEHGGINPLHVPGIPPGGGALPFGSGRPDAGSSLPAPRTASPQPSPPPARPVASGAAPTGQPPAPVVPNSPIAPRPAAPSGQMPTPAARSLPKNATGRLKPAAPIENAAMPADRHYVDRIKMGSPRRPKNTIILRNVDIRPDIQAIRMGRAMRDGPYYVINGRYYEMHEGGTTYPVQGPGFVTLDRGASRALGIYNSLGETPEAESMLDREGISPEQRQAARNARAS